MIAAGNFLERPKMAAKEKKLIATREMIAHYSMFDKNFVDRCAVRGQIDTEDLASVCIWLAEHGKPELRAQMARRLVPAVLGVSGQDQTKNDRLAALVEDVDILLSIFKRVDKPRQTRAKQIGRTKSGA
jgi:DNA polymerase III epsilon subunit-like protein